MNSYAQTGLIKFLSEFYPTMHCFLMIFCGDTSGFDRIKQKAQNAKIKTSCLRGDNSFKFLTHFYGFTCY